MTADQLVSVERAVVAALKRHPLCDRPEAVALAEAVVREALQAYPADHSCRTCDYFTRSRQSDGLGVYCDSWADDVPDDVIEVGCARHQTDGAPF